MSTFHVSYRGHVWQFWRQTAMQALCAWKVRGGFWVNGRQPHNASAPDSVTCGATINLYKPPNDLRFP